MLVFGILAITIVGCCLGPLVYVAVIVMDHISKIVFWFWDHTIPDNSKKSGVSSHRREPEPPPPVWIGKEASDE